ncbi:MAG: hypothetical protein Kow0031_03670 [Anaerolineae bacterium]
MAKRKRASLKDKSPETLGLTQRKGKGIDLLFGGPVEGEESDAAETTSSGLVIDDTAGETPGQADTGREVDELGLPVALEAPPDDMILASEPVGGSSTLISGEADAVNPETSPFAMPTPVNSEAGLPPDAADDLSGILDDENSPEVEEEKLANSDKETDLTGIVDSSMSADPANDLSGLIVDDNLSGLVVEEPAGDTGILPGVPAADLSGLTAAGTMPEPVTAADPANDLSGLISADEGLSGLAVDQPVAPATPVEPVPVATGPVSAPPPTTAAPINVPPPAYPTPMDYQPTPAVAGADVPATFSQPAATPATPTIPPPSTATGAPSLAAPRPAPIQMEGLSSEAVTTLGAFGAAFADDPAAFRPQDPLPDHQITVRDEKLAELDKAHQQEILTFLGNRPTTLFEEIEQMNDEVSRELSANKTDVSFALETLLDASNIILERPYQYEEALYRVSLVKTMLVRKERLSRASYGPAGYFVLFYGIISVILSIWGIFAGFSIDFVTMVGQELGPIFQAIFLSGLAGLMGGAVEILWRLYYRVSIKQDFDPQYLMYYIVKPVLGFVLGLVMYFLVAVGTTVVTPGGGETSLPAAGATTGFVLTMLLGFVAGYRQESVFDMIYVLIKKIAPAEVKAGPKSVKPIDDDLDISEHSGITS